METARSSSRDDELRELALLIRQGLKVIVVGIEKRYGLREETGAEAKSGHNQRVIADRARRQSERC